MMTPEQAYERFRKIVKYEARHVAYASQGLELIPLDERKQDAWVRILSRLPQIETKKNAEAYVRTLVRNAIRNTARKIYFADGEGFTVRERGATDHNFGSYQYTLREDEMLDILGLSKIKTGSWLDGNYGDYISFDALDGDRDTKKLVKVVNKLAKCLTPQENLVLRLSYGLGREPLGSHQIAAMMTRQGKAVSANAVDKLRERALKTLRKYLPLYL